MKKPFLLLISFILLTTILPISSTASTDINPATWSYVDGLGRTDSTFGKIPEERTDHERAVGIFYHTWHTEFSNIRVPVNMSETVKKYPEAAENVKTNDFWYQRFERFYQPGYFWDEPIFGYYTTPDKYVLRKHAEMLADAGVDFIYIDCTNGKFMWESGVTAILKVFAEAREDGVDAPQVVFWLSLGDKNNRIEQLKILYKYWYSKPEYDDMWFKWEGKPLLLCYEDVKNETYENSTEINNLFTFRPINPSYFNQGLADEYHWGWLSIYPQCKYGKTEDKGRPEQMAVGVAQNADSRTNMLSHMAAGDFIMGRSYAGIDTDTNKEYSYSYTYAGNTYNVNTRDEFATLAGRNFQQQWDYAIECDPDVILVTGWNEWTSNRDSGFCDAFTEEYSRDIEPTKGLLKDHYYYQMVANIRRYKGVDKADWNEKDKYAIDIFSDDLTQWDNITSYDHYTGSTRDRKCTGYRNCRFENFTMRNDFVTSKVAYDDSNFYFYVSTVDPISPETDNAWMRLFIDTDYSGNSQNWEGFEYVINRTNPQNGKLVLERSTGVDGEGTWLWETVNSEIEYSVKGNILQLKIPKASLGFNENKFDFSFKWSDNMQVDGDVMDFYTNGDVAPGGRFCFRFHNIEEIDPPSNWPITIIIASAIAILIIILLIVLIVITKKKRAVAVVSDNNQNISNSDT